jgi:hypothetical protein
MSLITAAFAVSASTAVAAAVVLPARGLAGGLLLASSLAGALSSELAASVAAAGDIWDGCRDRGVKTSSSLLELAQSSSSSRACAVRGFAPFAAALRASTACPPAAGRASSTSESSSLLDSTALPLVAT